MRTVLIILLKLVVSAAVSLGLILLVLRLSGTAGPDGGPDLPLVLSTTVHVGLGLYLLLHLAGAFFRALRFRLLIAAGWDQRPPGLGHMMLVSLVRNMMVDLLPARLGELSYIALMNRGYRVPGDRCVSSLSISFIFDMIALVGLVLALVVIEAVDGDSGLPLPLMFAALAVPVGLVAGLLFWGVEPGARLLRGFAGSLGRRRVVGSVLAFIDRVAAAIAATVRGGVVGRVLVLSLAVRLTKYGGMFALFLAVTRASMPDLHAASFLQVMLALVGGEAGASLALPTLMGFGAYEAGSVMAMAWAGFATAQVAVAMLALHIWSQAIDYTLGGLAFVAFLFTTPGSPHLAWSPRVRRRLLTATAVGMALMLVTGAWAWQKRVRLKAGSPTPPPPGEVVEPLDSDTAAGRALTGGLQGIIVWSSNRDGNHDIFRMTLPAGHVAPLTRHPHAEYFPRLSPDGRHLVFARSVEPWVSQRNRLKWDVYLLDLERGEERLVARAADTPTWSAAGDAVYFQRGGNTLVRHELATGAEQVLFDGPARGLSTGTQFETPNISTHGERLAVTLRGDIRQATIILPHAGDMRRVAGGCQLFWGHNDSYLYQVDKGGSRPRENIFFRIDAGTLERTPWLEIPGAYSHVYFPRVSADGRYLVFGASAGGHEHDQADYEIFLWRIGDPPESVARLTFHTGNDCWPDIHLAATP